MKALVEASLSIGPVFRADWKSIEYLAMVSPLRHPLVHQRFEANIVSWFEDMDHFVDNAVLQALARLLG